MAQKDHLTGYWIMLGSAFSGAIVANCYKALTFSLSPEMLVFFTRCFPFLAFFPVILHQKKRLFRAKKMPLLFLMAFFYFLAMYGYMTALKYIPVLQASLLFNCGPLWTPFIARIFLNEEIHKKVWYGILTSFAGVILVIQPGLSAFHPIALLSLLSGVSMACALVTNRKLSESNRAQTIVFYNMCIMLVMSLFPALFVGITWPYPLNASIWPIFLLLIAGLGSYGYQYMRAKAVSLVAVSKVMPFSFFGPIFAGLLAWLFFDSTPNFLFIIGTVLVLGGMTFILKNK